MSVSRNLDLNNFIKESPSRQFYMTFAIQKQIILILLNFEMTSKLRVHFRTEHKRFFWVLQISDKAQIVLKMCQKWSMWRIKNKGLSIFLGVFFPISPLISLILLRHMGNFWHNFNTIWALSNIFHDNKFLIDILKNHCMWSWIYC